MSLFLSFSWRTKTVSVTTFYISVYFRRGVWVGGRGEDIRNISPVRITYLLLNISSESLIASSLDLRIYGTIFLFPNQCPYSGIYPWVPKFSFGHFWENKLVYSFNDSIHISWTLMWAKSCDIKRSESVLIWSFRPWISARVPLLLIGRIKKLSS